MGVYIASMQMPKCCDECPIRHMTLSWCNIAKRSTSHSDSYKPLDQSKRPSWCPLTEVKTPHGRLVDADELWNKMSNYIDNEGAKFPFGDDDSIIQRDSACFMIESADTIIEAEGVE